MVQSVWDEIPIYYPNVDLDAFILMPNHIHGIIVLEPNSQERSMTLGDVVHRLKSLTTAKYRHGVNQQKFMPFQGRLWHRNYYEHIIRNEESYDHLRHYISTNPLRRKEDTLHPDQNNSW